MNNPKPSTEPEVLTESIKAITYLSLKTGKASKTGQRSHGQLHYRILTDTHHEHLYLTITGNDGGGYYSKEIVPFDKVEQCLDGINTHKPLSSKLFQAAFIGQSSNNAGFLAAILRAEKLLAPVTGALHQHALQPDWPVWKAKLLALADNAESFQPESPKPKAGITKDTKNSVQTDESAQNDDQKPSLDPDSEDANAIVIDPLESDDAEMINVPLELTALGKDITNQDGAEGIESIATVLDKHQAKRQRSEKRQHPTVQDTRHDSVA
ncbi:MAG: hypothetical protein Q7U57_19510 [Methylovulum sp.]|nr:hypothetical protein [Methylovulum sp.]